MAEVGRLQIVFIVIAIVLWLLVYTPLLIYHGIRYYKSRNHVVYQARYANITIYEVIFMIIKLVYGCFDNAMAVLLFGSSFIYQLIDSINSFLAYFVLYCFVWRFACISYEIMWTKYVVDHEWKKIINSKNTQNTQSNKTVNASNWYLQNKNTFGNHKWVQRRIFVFAIFSALTNIIGSIYGAKIYGKHASNVYVVQIIASWPYTLPLIFLIIIYCKTPSFLDHFYIQTEMKYIFVLWCIDYIGYYGGLICAALMVETYGQITVNIIISITFNFVITAQFGSVMIATSWVNHKVDKIINADRYKIKEIMIENDDKDSLLSNSSISSKQQSAKFELIEIEPKRRKMKTMDYVSNISKPLLEFISHPVAFESFMTHLSYELSMENLLSFVEFLQFQRYAADKINYDERNDNNLLCDMIILPDTVPLSSIVYDDGIDVKYKAYLLYEKYISNDSVYTINLSFRVKRNVSNLMINYDEWMSNNNNITDIELMNLFDECCNEMKQIMQDSYGRFKLTPKYHNLVSNLLFVK